MSACRGADLMKSYKRFVVEIVKGAHGMNKTGSTGASLPMRMNGGKGAGDGAAGGGDGDGDGDGDDR